MCTCTYPCCVLSEVAPFVFDGVGVSELLQELHLFYDVLPFLWAKRENSSKKNQLVFVNEFALSDSILLRYKLYFDPDLIGLFATERHLLDGHNFIGTHIMSLREKMQSYREPYDRRTSTSIANYWHGLLTKYTAPKLP